MRTIKFRAWDKKEKRMGDVIALTLNKAQVCFRGGGGQTCYPFSLQSIELMQFTGLKDKNGKEIYEGDIISKSNSGDKNLNVYWSDEQGGWCIFQFGHEEELLADELDGESEVIGNIYENLELLKL